MFGSQRKSFTKILLRMMIVYKKLWHEVKNQFEHLGIISCKKQLVVSLLLISGKSQFDDYLEEYDKQLVRKLLEKVIVYNDGVGWN